MLCELSMQGSKFKVSKKRLDFTLDVTNVDDLLTAASSNSKDTNPVVDLKFDPNAESYLLIAHRNGRLLLCDVASLRLITAFSRQSGKISCVQWIPHIPGGFLTSDTRTGILRIWSVSNM